MLKLQAPIEERKTNFENTTSKIAEYIGWLQNQVLVRDFEGFFSNKNRKFSINSNKLKKYVEGLEFCGRGYYIR